MARDKDAFLHRQHLSNDGLPERFPVICLPYCGSSVNSVPHTHPASVFQLSPWRGCGYLHNPQVLPAHPHPDTAPYFERVKRF